MIERVSIRNTTVDPQKTATKGKLVLDLLYHVWRIRLVEERIAALYSEQQMRCPVHLSIGQEGVAVGVCAALTNKDAVMSGHRAHAHYLAKGGNLQRMMAEIYGKATGCSLGRGGSMHLIDLDAGFIGSTPIVGSTIPMATGLAWSAKMQRKNIVTVLFMGETAAEEGVWHESLNFAALHKLPILFVCENNLYSVYTHIKDRQPSRPLTGMAAAHSLRVYGGDGNNALEVHRLAKDALSHVRAGKGPVFMEFSTYRWREHCGPNYDNDLGYRSEAEFQEWKEKDPLARLRQHVLQERYTTKDKLAAEERGITEEIDAAVTFAKMSPSPTAEDLSSSHTYAAI